MRKLNHRRIEHRHSSQLSGRAVSEPKREWYWILFSKDGVHKALWGAYPTYEEADRKAVSKLNVLYEIIKLPTRDETTASRLVRSDVLNNTGNMETTFRRFSHKED